MAYVDHSPDATRRSAARVGHTTAFWSFSNAEDVARVVLRALLGMLLLVHGISKMRDGVGPVADMLQAASLPRELAYLAYVGEVLAPMMVLVGAWTRVGASLVIVHMLFAIGLAHRGELFAVSEQGGYALELQAFYLLSAVAILLLGAGRYSADGRDPWRH